MSKLYKCSKIPNFVGLEISRVNGKVVLCPMPSRDDMRLLHIQQKTAVTPSIVCFEEDLTELTQEEVDAIDAKKTPLPAVTVDAEKPQAIDLGPSDVTPKIIVE